MADEASAAPVTLWTVGHSTRAEDELAGLLAAHGIARVVDVRRFPGSRRHPQYARESLERWLPAIGCAYVWMGDDLGGFRKAPAGTAGAAGAEASLWTGYRQHMRSPAFAAALDRLVTLARERPTAVMCAEAVYFRCHRQLIAEALTARGHRVRHIFSERDARDHHPGLDLGEVPVAAGALEGRKR